MVETLALDVEIPERVGGHATAEKHAGGCEKGELAPDAQPPEEPFVPCRRVKQLGQEVHNSQFRQSKGHKAWNEGRRRPQDGVFLVLLRE